MLSTPGVTRSCLLVLVSALYKPTSSGWRRMASLNPTIGRTCCIATEPRLATVLLNLWTVGQKRPDLSYRWARCLQKFSLFLVMPLGLMLSCVARQLPSSVPTSISLFNPLVLLFHTVNKRAFNANVKLKKMDGALEDLCMKINKDTKLIQHQYKMSRDKAKEIYKKAMSRAKEVYNKSMDNVNNNKKAGRRRSHPVGIVQEVQSNQRP